MKDDRIAISVSIANTTKLTPEELIEFLKSNNPEIEIYRFRGTPGKITNAAFDWQIIDHIGSIVGIFGFFWMVYERLFKEKEITNEDAGIVIRINTNDWNNVFFIGGVIKSREELISKVTEFLANNKFDPFEIQEIISEIENSPNWRKVDTIELY